MKSKEEIEKLAKEEIERYRQSTSSIDNPKEIQRFNGFIIGYTQCQEDIKPLLKDLWDLWERLAEVGELHIGKNFTKKYEELKNSLNKQD